MELDKGDGLHNLLETTHGGITKTLWWLESIDHAFITVQDDFENNSFSVDVPKDCNPLEYMAHIMLHAPEK